MKQYSGTNGIAASVSVADAVLAGKCDIGVLFDIDSMPLVRSCNQLVLQSFSEYQRHVAPLVRSDSIFANGFEVACGDIAPGMVLIASVVFGAISIVCVSFVCCNLRKWIKVHGE